MSQRNLAKPFIGLVNRHHHSQILWQSVSRDPEWKLTTYQSGTSLKHHHVLNLFESFTLVVKSWCYRHTFFNSQVSQPSCGVLFVQCWRYGQYWTFLWLFLSEKYHATSHPCYLKNRPRFIWLRSLYKWSSFVKKWTIPCGHWTSRTKFQTAAWCNSRETKPKDPCNVCSGLTNNPNGSKPPIGVVCSPYQGEKNGFTKNIRGVPCCL